ncbi:protein (fungal and plant) [Ophiostoma piceae UAMH 11346]|uniref:Protein (Fungal and plant) n=1 Tax=Ophiostoma piceae (strain UAMH 11346) TaxID=1262450 RepID=S3CAG9_OPHP1|nr:protein (fungal and plant) [Ophiostoma piceae UAMH 11346]
MRLFLLPVSSRRTLLYCERLEQAGQQAKASMSVIDKATVKAAKLWSEWEHKPAGTWQHRIVSSGNAGLRRIAFEEWGLKSVPPLSSRQKAKAAKAVANAFDSPALELELERAIWQVETALTKEKAAKEEQQEQQKQEQQKEQQQKVSEPATEEKAKQ